MRKTRQLVSIMLILLVSISALIGCVDESAKKVEEHTTESKKDTSKEVGKETPYIEVWLENSGYQEVTKDGPQSSFFIEHTGIGVYQPYVPWEGGNGYIQRLNTRIATGDLPDLFLPWKGNETTLIDQGAIADLTDYLPKYAPHIWETIPESVWNAVRVADPTGEKRIYYIPRLQLYNNYGGFIRTDWLERVGKDVPTTQDELVDVLRAFKEQDANGNGDPTDELPTSGREFGRWMDYLYSMYGVAIWEGYPQWDIYEGELTYSGVTQNMRDAILFIKGLYEQGLLDQETFLNSQTDWKAKIKSDKVGIWYHLAKNIPSYLEPIKTLNPEVGCVALPNLSAPGYEGFITHMDINRPQWAIANKDEETIINALKLLDFTFDPANRELNTYRVEGVDHEVVDGKKVLIKRDKSTHESSVLKFDVITEDDLQFRTQLNKNSVSDDRKWVFDMQLSIGNEFQELEKTIAGDGLPNSVYNEYSDIRQHTLYQEYMTNIIIGKWPIEKFDEFVNIWYETGGEEVTKRAREWYDKINN